MTYDIAGRPENTYHRVGAGVEQLISQQEYTVKDQLQVKKLGGHNGNFLQNLDYAYKPNGFLKAINETMVSDDLFQFIIGYDSANPAIVAYGEKNGNISHLTWQVKGKTKQAYGFQYDFLNRLTKATYGDYSTSVLVGNNKYTSNYDYDERGNITHLTRQGFLPSTGNYGEIDKLEYHYDNTNSNQIQRIEDAAINSQEGFKPSASMDDYGYDENGSMNYDPYKGMTVRYNHLNLPEFIEFPDCKVIEYTYDASGIKLKKILKHSNTTFSTHDYVGGIEYKNEVIDGIYHTEGRLYFEGEESRYEYVIRDHLGNSRLCFTDKDGDGTIDVTGDNETTEILEENHYYPFGMRMGGDWLENQGRENKYLFNGKELDSDFGLDWYHYGARMYDPTIARFTGVDPLAEPQAAFSTYHYTYNNPIKFIDPTGMMGESTVGADGLTNEQWIQASRAGADPSLTKQYQNQNRAAARGKGEKTSFAAFINFDDYPIDVEEVTGGRISRLPLGHSGILLVTESGATQYYEYGRYDEEDLGLVRRKSVKDLSIGSDGIPTKASVERMLRHMSKTIGRGSSITASFFRTNDTGGINSYIQDRFSENNNPNRTPYSIASRGGYNCSSFACNAIRNAQDIYIGGIPTYSPGYTSSMMQSAAGLIYHYNSQTGKTSLTNKLKQSWFNFNLFGDERP